MEEIAFRGLCHDICETLLTSAFSPRSPLKSQNCRNHLCCLNSGRSHPKNHGTALIYTVRFLAARRGRRTAMPITEVSSSARIHPNPLAFSLPHVLPVHVCSGSQLAPPAGPACGQTLLDPSLIHRPTWGELRLKDPYCLSPRGSRGPGKGNDFTPTT